MTNEEYALKIQQGNTELYGELWGNVYKLIITLARRFYLANSDICTANGVTLDDLIQSSYFSLIKAVNAYKPSKGYLLSTYLNFHLLNQYREMTGGRKKRDPLSICASLDVPLPEQEKTTLGDTVKDPSDQMSAADERLYNEKLRAVLNEKLAELPTEQKTTLRERYYNNRTYKEIGEITGLSISKTRSTMFYALAKLKRNRELKSLYYAAYDSAYRSTSLTTFKNLHASSVELTAEKIEKLESKIKAES